jgi:glucose-1-phosphate adenylyltransferase
VLIDELRRSVAGPGEDCTFQIHEVMRQMIPRRRAYGWVYHGPWHYTRSLDEYVQFHQDLLGTQPKIDLDAWQVRSNFLSRRTAPPSPVRYLPGANVDNCLVSPGCMIAGTVRNSVLSPGVRVEAGASVVDSVLCDDVVVEAGAHLDRVVSDKRTWFGPEARVGEGSTVVSEAMPESLTCGATIIGMDVRIPPKARVGRGCLIHPGVIGEDFRGPLPSGQSLRPSQSRKEVRS